MVVMGLPGRKVQLAPQARKVFLVRKVTPASLVLLALLAKRAIQVTLELKDLLA